MLSIITALFFLGGAATTGLSIGGTKLIAKKKGANWGGHQTRATKKLHDDLEGLKTSLRSRINAEIQADIVMRGNGAMVSVRLIEFEDNEKSWLTWGGTHDSRWPYLPIQIPGQIMQVTQ